MVNCKHFNPTVNESYTTDMGVVDSHVHEIDVLRWLLNDDYKSARVQFPRSTSRAREGVKDPQIVTLETKSGIIITTQIFVNCHYGYDIQCEVIGEDGIVSLPEPNLAWVRKEGQLQREIFMDWKKRFIEAYDIELQAFVDGVIQGELKQGATAWDGYVASVTADACAKSQQTGHTEPIELPEIPLFYAKK
ncbi:Gfo/Idh/MocA family oxidoreductase [Pasteurellaceae bacterium LIM206]|nr:Gfo/Idh/MocA family oxidoreductase [Pasteurellaceae bacterium LIM206]